MKDIQEWDRYHQFLNRNRIYQLISDFEHLNFIEEVDFKSLKDKIPIFPAHKGNKYLYLASPLITVGLKTSKNYAGNRAVDRSIVRKKLRKALRLTFLYHANPGMEVFYFERLFLHN